MSQQMVINSLSFAREGRLLQGELPLSSFERIQDMLAGPATVSGAFASLRYRLQGAVNRQGKPQLLLDLEGAVPVVCQRCLERFDYPVSVTSTFELVADEAEIGQEALEDDSLDFLVAQKEMDVLALIEDELILALPSAPRHESCELPDSSTRGTRVSPFAALAALKGKEA